MIQFVNPFFLFAGLLIAIPIVIHLFYFRRFKKVYFTNVRFLREVKEETSARQKLRNLLVLLMRCLAVLMLVLAFAQPFIPRNNLVKQGEKSVSIFIDNSFSMGALSKDVSLLEKARQRAKEIVAAYAPDDRFQILTQDFEGRHQRLVNRDDAITYIEEIRLSPAVNELSKVITRQQQALSSGQSQQRIMYLLSDFQKNISDLDQIRDTLTDIYLVPMSAVQENNLSIDSAWFEAPVQVLNQTSPLIVKVTNHSDEAVENARLTLVFDGQDKPVGLLTVPPRQSITDTVNITILRTGWHQARLTVADYPVQFDDDYYFTYLVDDQIKVLAINDGLPDRYLGAALRGIPGFQVTDQGNTAIDYAGIPQYQFIVIDGLPQITTGLADALAKYISQGGNVLVFPGNIIDQASYNAFLRRFQSYTMGPFDSAPRQVSAVNTDEFVFQDVFTNANANLKLPATTGNYVLSATGTSGGEALLTYRDGTVFAGKTHVDKGNLYICAAPLDDQKNDIMRIGEIFVPMLYKMAISAARSWKISYTISRDDIIEADHQPAGTEAVYKFRSEKGEFIPGQRVIGQQVILSMEGQVREAGFFDLYTRPDTVLSRYAFNYDRRESDLRCLAPGELTAFTSRNIHLLDATSEANLSEIVGERNQGLVLWRWCILLALLFLAVEVMLLRFWKV